MEKNELYHHGVKGMKWGVRRDKRLAKIDAKAKKQGWSDDARKAAEIGTKKLKQMSNSDLRTYNERKQLERQYAALKAHSSSIDRGMAYVNSATDVMNTGVGFYNATSSTVKTGKKITNSIMKRK